jgi:hypothetical protein
MARWQNHARCTIMPESCPMISYFLAVGDSNLHRFEIWAASKTFEYSTWSMLLYHKNKYKTICWEIFELYCLFRALGQYLQLGFSERMGEFDFCPSIMPGW